MAHVFSYSQIPAMQVGFAEGFPVTFPGFAAGFLLGKFPFIIVLGFSFLFILLPQLIKGQRDMYQR